jgi:hypothetical protein
MDDLQAIRNFRAEVPIWREGDRRGARTLLLSRIAEESKAPGRARATPWRSIVYGIRVRRWSRLATVAAAVALAGLTAASALALYGLVEGDPAPESVRKELQQVASPSPLRVGHRVIERPKPPPPDLVNARLAVALESSIGPVYLWTAPKEDGGACWVIEITALPRLSNGRVNTAGGCSPPPSAELPIVPGGGEAGVGGESVRYVHGQVRPNIKRLQATLSDGSVVDLRLVDGFFLAELPSSQDVVGYSGFDASGAVVGNERVPTPPRAPKPIEPFQEAISIRLFSGREAVIEYARTTSGGLCWRSYVDIRPPGPGCSPVQEHSLPSLESTGVGENQRLLLLGPVGSEFAQVEIVWDDGAREPMRTLNGFGLKQLDPKGARLPVRIVGRDDAGRIVAERPVFGPG